MAVDSQQVQSQDVPAGQEAPSEQPQERSGGPFDFIRNLWSGRGGSEQDAEASEGAGEGTEASPATAKADQQDAPVSLSREELRRLVQSEADKEISRRARLNETKAQRDARLKLARENPYELADQVEKELTEQERAESQQAQFAQSIAPVLQLVDAEIVGAVVQALPEDARKKVLENVPADLVGVAERNHIVNASLKQLEAHWKAQGAAEAEAKLRKNGAIVKQVLAEQRAEQEEPDLVPAAGAPHRTDMDSWLRSAAGA